MEYCPNCSAYQYDPDAALCRKCGFDMAAHVAIIKQRRSSEEIRKTEDKKTGFDEGNPCPSCGGPTRSFSSTLEIQHEGQRINVHGLKLMGGEITKRTVTQYQVRVQGMECSDGHKFFFGLDSKTKALCPLCMDAMMEYGSSLYSCSRCQKHFSKADWSFPDDEEVMVSEGWEKLSGPTGNL